LTLRCAGEANTEGKEFLVLGLHVGDREREASEPPD
jgi:hypothetical protein